MKVYVRKCRESLTRAQPHTHSHKTTSTRTQILVDLSSFVEAYILTPTMSGRSGGKGGGGGRGRQQGAYDSNGGRRGGGRGERESVRIDGGEVPGGSNAGSHGSASQLGDRDLALKEEMRKDRLARANRSPVYTGVIVEMRDNFGFVQPLCSAGLITATSQDLAKLMEQLYFSDREGFAGATIGMEVFFRVKDTNRGPQAVTVRPVPQSEKVVYMGAMLTGEVVKEVENHRTCRPMIVKLSEESKTKLAGSPPGGISLDGSMEVVSAVRGWGEDPVDNPDVTYLSGASKDSRGTGIGATGEGPRGMPRNTGALRRGDHVEVILKYVPHTSYCVAVGVKLMKSKAEKQKEDSLAAMKASGVQCEQGIVESVKPQERYGFIRGADRNSQIFFRFDDIQPVGDSSVAEVSVGTEFEFYCIAENARGKMSDRAVGITYLSRGTVQMEYLLAEQVLATVVEEPVMHPQEEPGKLALREPLALPPQIASKLVTTAAAGGEGLAGTLKEIELWQRCCPDNLAFRCGDTIRINVHYYRPQKLFFSRDVSVDAFRLVGREKGRIRSLKQGYGFASLSDAKLGSGDTAVIGAIGPGDIPGLEGGASTEEKFVYFRTTEVVGPEGKVMRENDLRPNMPLSFEVAYEAGKGGEVRLRAVRIRVELSSGLGTDNASSTHGGAGDVSHLVLLRDNVSGVVVREIGKPARGSGSVESGVIRITDVGALQSPSSEKEEGDASRSPGLDHEGEGQVTLINASVRQEVAALTAPTRAIVLALLQFKEQSALTKRRTVVIDHMYLHLAIRFFSVLSDYDTRDGDTDPRTSKARGGLTQQLRGLCCEYVDGPITGGQAKSLKVHLLSGFGPDESPTPKQAQEYDTWCSRTRAMLVESAKQGYTVGIEREVALSSSGKGGTQEKGASVPTDPDELLHAEIAFGKEESSDKFGPLTRESSVQCRIYRDPIKKECVLRDVCLTDEPIPSIDGTGKSRSVGVGVLESVFARGGGRHGHLRAIPTDEKLFWHSSAVSSRGGGVAVKALVEGVVVKFESRRRGGHRVAVDLLPLTRGTEELNEVMLKSPEEGENRCVVVGDGTTAVPLHVSRSAQVVPAFPAGQHNRLKLWDLSVVSGLLSLAATSLGSGKINPRTKKPLKSDGVWGREAVPDGAEAEDSAPAGQPAPAETAVPAAVALPPAPPTEDSPREEKEGDDVRFYPPLLRSVVPIADAGLHKYMWTPPVEGATAGASSIERPGYTPGTILTCDIKYSPLSRQILSVHNTRLPSSAGRDGAGASMAKKKGVITRTGVRLKTFHAGPDSPDALPEEALELVEIRSGDPSSDVTEDYAYCVWPLELGPAAGSVNVNAAATVSVGDEVEYFIHRHKDKESTSGKPLMVALGATLTRSGRSGSTSSSDGGGGIVFTRPGSLNSVLQKNITSQKASKITGHKGVVMAKGPAEDGSTGFTPGWRSQERVAEWKDLPWAHLLPWQELMQAGK